jgi:ATP-dependent Lon protease
MAPGEFPPKRLQFFGVDTLTAADLVRARALDQHDERLNEHPDVGEITALLAMVNSEGEPIGGDVQVIQSSLLPGNAGLTLTGFHGPAMEQSAKAAYHYLRDHRTEFRIPVESMENAQLAVHLVQIEQNREGPSAGLAFLLAMLSALTGRAVSPALAVTGEVALHGQILPVGGLIPKLYAALRHGRRRVIVPEENRRQVDDAPPPLRDHLEICLVATVAEAVQHAYGLRVVPPRWSQES